MTPPSLCPAAHPAAGRLHHHHQRPARCGLDQWWNIVTDVTHGIPNLYQMNVTKGFVNYGVGLNPTVANRQDLHLFNIGNQPLSLTPNSYAFKGPDLADYTLTKPGGGTQ